MTLAIAHRSIVGGLVLDCVCERRAPFSPAEAVAEFVGVLRAYRISTVTGDRYAGEWPREAFRSHGIRYQPAEASKSEYYGALLPLINARQVELLDHPRLIAQLAGLERRTARSGRDSIDHGPGGHDDVVNAAAGALVTTQSSRRLVISSLSAGAPTRLRGAIPMEISNRFHPGYTGPPRGRTVLASEPPDFRRDDGGTSPGAPRKLHIRAYRWPAD